MLLCRPKSREWSFHTSDCVTSSVRSPYSEWILRQLLSVAQDPAMLRRTRQLESGQPVPTVLHFVGWQGDLDTEPMVFLFLHTCTWNWFEQRYLVVSIRHRTMAQRLGRLRVEGLRQFLLDFRTQQNRPLFSSQTLPSPFGVGLLVNEKRRPHEKDLAE